VLVVLLALTLLFWRGPIAGRDKEGSAAFRELLLSAQVNGQETGQASLLLQGDDQTIWASVEDLKHWRLRRPAGVTYEHLDRLYAPLSGLDGVSYRMDLSLAMLSIEAAPRAFERSVQDADASSAAPSAPPMLGGFFNYDLHAGILPERGQASGLFELGLFKGTGVLVNSALFQQSAGANGLVRLDTTLFRDLPDRMSSLEIGDAAIRPGAWGRAVRFGGLRYGTKFATRPGFTSFPLPAAKGQASLPSAVDLYVNNALVLRRQVPPGPFAIANVPVVTGDGEIQLVVTDALGRQQLTAQTFYASSQLLREGLDDYSYELGFARRDFGIASNDYGPALGAATYRKGLSNTLTGEWRAEAQPGLAVAGATFDWLVRETGVLTAGGAASRSGGRTGSLAVLGFQRRANPFSYAARMEWHGSAFGQLGIDADMPRLREMALASASYRMRGAGSIAVAYARQLFTDGPPGAALTATYTLGLGKLGSLSISATRAFGETRADFIFVELSIPLTTASSASFSHASAYGSGQRSSTAAATLQRSLPAGPGYGYRLLAREDGSGQAALSLQNRLGTYTVEAARTAEVSAARIEASGGTGWLGSRLFFSRAIQESFAIVRVPEHRAVRIYQDNNVAATTDADGYAVLPRLRAYEANRIGVEQDDLPLDSIIDRLTLETVPSYRSGVYVEFPIRRSRSATLRLLFEDGTPVPAGASARLEGNPTPFAVAQDGHAFVSGLRDTNRLLVFWKERRCEVDIVARLHAEPLPDLGAFVCKWVKQ
jgi:outer membrane usher protein